MSFFALDATEGIFSIDFPGVYSKVDFSQLSFPQISEVIQEPLDVDANSGIRLRFVIRDQVKCSVFEGAEGEVTLFFESEDHVAETLAATEEAPVGESAVPVSFALDGVPGKKRLNGLTLAAQERTGVVRLAVDGLQNYRQFFLSNPDRFVLDLEETIADLQENTLTADSALIQRVRVSQFRISPKPITRCVLDLQRPAHIQVLQVDGGVAVAFADQKEALTTLVSTLEMGMGAARTAQVVDSPQEPEIEVPAQVEEPIAAEDEMASAGVAALEDHTDIAPVIEEPADEIEETRTEMVADTAMDDFSTDSAPESLPAPEQVTAPVVEPVAAQVAVVEEKPAATIEKTPTATIEESPAQTSNVATAAAAPAPIVEEPAAVPADNGIAAELDGFGSEQARTELPQVREVAVSRNDQAPAKVDLPKPQFEIASDMDMEMRDFVAEDQEDSFYGMMRNVRSNHRELDTIIVTNNAIESSKLREMRPMQQAEGESEDFATLFSEDEDSDYETIDGGEQEYRGFEISIIDVKDADVVDLLRFIADQVGINLYVDSSVGTIKATYRFRNIPWDQALDIILTNANLAKEFKNGVLRVATTEKFRQEEIARAQLRTQRELSVPPETVTFPLSYAKAPEVVPIVEQYLSPRGTILMDERTNTLIIEDIPKRMVAIRALIKKLDKMISQVTIEARIVESSKRFLRELGVQWGLSATYSPELGTNTGLDFPNRVGVGGPLIGNTSPGGLQGGYAVNFPAVSENPSGIGLSLGNFLDNFKLDISLQMLETSGEGQIISAPKITTQNNKTATIKNGQRIPIQTIQRGTITIRYIEAVLELHVTPHITSDETIIMDVVVDKSEADFTRAVGGNPVINVRRAETRLLVKNGGTAVIGGIFTLNEQTSEEGIPTLRKVPFIRRLFGHELKQFENQELLIFITPRIVKY
ncbi:type IV pilus secretin family protein [Sulfidibacter corallicola]|uniref:Type IV pilus secretin PilQ n=1 Tax=Sulfidibacter corallicola TaxID=2818388 RepID=A0A8A4TST4_SULCO|nr:type IV pilus secretin family protein [Sulfidibacter corallicola]QTD53016.1 type IV pilus secretin PilQ [Sulfidibacter corallicola]